MTSRPPPLPGGPPTPAMHRASRAGLAGPSPGGDSSPDPASPPRSLRRVPSPSPRTTLPRAPSARGTPCAPPPSSSPPTTTEPRTSPDGRGSPATPRCSPSPTPRCAAPTSRPPSIAPRRANPASPSPCTPSATRATRTPPGNSAPVPTPRQPKHHPRTRTTPRTTLLTPTRPRPRGCTRRRSRTVRRARLKSERAPSGFDSARRPVRSPRPRPLPPPPRSPRPRARASGPTRGTARSRSTRRRVVSAAGAADARVRVEGKRRERDERVRVGVQERAEQSRRHLTGGGHPCGGGRHPGGGHPHRRRPGVERAAEGRARGGFDIHEQIPTGACRKYRRVQFFSNLRGVSETWELLAAARGASTTGGADGARWTARANRRPPRRNPVGVHRRSPRRNPRSLARWRRSSASLAPNLVDSAVVISASFVRVETPRWRSSSCDSRSPRASPSRPRLQETRDDRARERRDGRSRPWRWGYRSAASPDSTGDVTSGVLGGWRGMNVMDVVRMSNRLLRNFARKPRNVHRRAFATGVERRSPRATRDASPRRRSFDRIVGDARARRSRAPRASNVVCSREDPSGGTSGARGVAREGARVGVERRLLEVAPKGCRATRRSKNHRARRSRRLARVHVARVRRVAASRVRQRRGEVRVRKVSSRWRRPEKARPFRAWRERARFLTDARDAHRRDFERDYRRVRRRLVSRAFSLWRLWTTSENRERRSDARAERAATRTFARRVATRATRGWREVSARARRERGDDARARRAAVRILRRRAFSYFSAWRYSTHPATVRARVTSLRRDAERSRREGSKIWSMFQKTRRAHAQLRAMTRWKRYVTRRAIGKSTCALAGRASCVVDARRRRSRVARRVRTNLRRGHVSREMRPRGAETIGNDDASRRVFRVARVRARRTRARASSRIDRRGSRRGGTFARAFSYVSAWRFAAEEATISRRRVEKMAFRRVVDATADAFARWGAYARASATARRLARRATDRFRGKRLATAFFEWARAAAESAARRARDAADHLAADAAREANARLETFRVAREARLVGRVTLRLRREAFDAYRDVVRRDRGLRYRLYKLLKRWNRRNVTPAFDAWKSTTRDAKRRGEAFRIVARRFARLEIARAFAAWVEIADDARRDEASRARRREMVRQNRLATRPNDARVSFTSGEPSRARVSSRSQAGASRGVANGAREDAGRVRPVDVVRG